jgi:GMP synthase (glutamine-hydrolysing)
MRHAIVIQHLGFEDLGTLTPALRFHEFDITTLQAGVDDLSSAYAADLLIVLGGPIGVYEQADYPFLTEELMIIQHRISNQKPVLGICLGAQLMAAAMGAKVFPGQNGKEIGWFPIRTMPSADTNILAPLAGHSVLHWHGDTFDLPAGVELLASSNRYPHQAFSVGQFGLALQFHAEVDTASMERWYIGHAVELANAGIAVQTLRQKSAIHGPLLKTSANKVWKKWLGNLRY